MKIMKLNGCVENYEGITYSWTCGEKEFELIYDKDGELYGLVNEDIEGKLASKIVYEPWNFDFPSTIEDYINELPEDVIELPMDVVYNLEAVGQKLAEITGFFLILPEARPRCYNFPKTGFNIWCDEFDKTYQIDVPKSLTKGELIALYQELKDLENIYDIKLI